MTDTYVELVFKTSRDGLQPTEGQVRSIAADAARQLAAAYGRSFEVTDVEIVVEEGYENEPLVDRGELEELDKQLQANPDAFGAITGRPGIDGKVADYDPWAPTP